MTSLFRNDAQRMLSLWFPYLATERVWRGRLGRSWRSRRRPPLAVSHRDRNAQRIYALDEQAEALGLKRDMGVADARAMHPSIDFVEADPAADRRVLEALADWCDRYTPLVALGEEGDGLFLDITGCAHLFGGETALLRDLVERLALQGFDARGGLASTPGAAWAAARCGLPPILPGEERPALTPLPLAALRLDPAVRSGLESVGLRTAGSVMDAPRAPLARRFGRQLLVRIDQALGDVEEALSPRLPVAPLSAERPLAEPVSRLEDVEQLILMLAASLKADLERRGEGARLLQAALFRVDGAVCRIEVGASVPMREPPSIGRLFHEKLAASGEELDAGFGFDLVRLSVLSTASFMEAQADMTGPKLADENAPAFFADRLRARHGEQALLRPLLQQSHVPERAVRLVPYSAAVPTEAFPAKERPVRLLSHAERVEVTAEVPEGPPRHFRWRRASYRVVRAEGPERIAPEWWRDEPDAPTRDYFRIEDEAGRRYWLYREGFYGDAQPPRWFLQGLFA